MPKNYLFAFILILFLVDDIYCQEKFQINPFQQLIQKLNASGTLTGRVYLDNNANGNQDPGEPGIENVNVIVINSNDSGTTVTTDVNGDWSLSVIPGNTLIFIDNNSLPVGSIQTEGSDPTVVDVLDNQTNDGGVDGYALVGDLNGRLYFDVNGNGTQDAGESGIANVDVQIDNAFGGSQTIETDANGDWNIQVPVGDVTSTIDVNDPDFPTGAIQTEGTNPTITTVTNGDTFDEVDGFFESGQLSGRLYYDVNGNGTQDGSESGIVNVDIQIDDALGNSQTIETDANGDWNIQVPVGNVTSTIDINDPDFPTGAIQTEGTNPTTTTINNGDTLNEVDGFFESGLLSGRLYFDVNGNSIQDGGESGIANVDVQIDDVLGNSQTVVTDANGDWNIQVPAGDVTSTIDINDPDFPTGAVQTEGTNPTTTTIINGDTFDEVDGFFESGQLSGRLYFDVNGNGIQDAGESGIANVDIQIDDALGNSQTLETDANGDWNIQVPIGNVTSTIDVNDPDFPTGAIQTEGTNPTTTSIINGDTFNEVDGFFESGLLSGRLYFDVNGNGTQDAGESGIANVDVQIDDALGNSQTVVTDANGDWNIQAPVGDVTSTIDVNDPDFPTGAIQTEGTNPTITTITNGDTFDEVDGFFESGQLSGRLYFDANGNGTQDAGESGISDVDIQIDDALGDSQIVVTDTNGDWSVQVPVGDATSTIDVNDPEFPTGAIQTEGTNPTITTITNGGTFDEVDGFFDSGQLSGRLYYDVNGNGTQDAGESGISDVDIQIDDALGDSQTIETDANGDWNVQVPVGDVTSTIDVNDPEFPTGAFQTEGTNPTTTTITNGDTFDEVDGFFESGQLSGRLYFDANGSGTQDAGETGIANVDIEIDNALGNSQIVVTDANGDWNIQVPVGDVTSTIDVNDPEFPTGAVQTEGTNPTTTTITNGDTFDEVDGFFETGQLSGRLYLDANGNGTQDAGESGISDVDIEIDDALGNSQIVVTDANGDWIIQVPVGDVTSTIDTNDPDFPLGATQTEGTNPTTTLITNGDAFSEIDGYEVQNPLGILTGHLYLDENGDGTQNAGEVDLPDIDIEITDSQNNIQVVSTDANGDWSITIPTGNAISDIDETDPDFPTGAIQTEGTDPTTTLVVQNTSTFSENDGFFVPDPNETGTLTGHLYLDENGDGTQNAGEADLPDIDIEITDSQSNIQIVSTDANGDWSVTIPSGNAISDIDETDPDFPAGAIQTEGTDPTTSLVVQNTSTFSENDGFFVPDPNETGTLTGHLYLDENGDGTQNAGEANLPDIDIEITDSQNNIQIVSTDADGDWSVTIPTGNAISDIDENDPDFPVGAIQTEGTDPTTTLVVPNTSNFSENDGFFVPDPNENGTLTGHLYLDENGNGTQNAGEANLSDIDIEITDSQNNIQIVSTDADGDWSVTIPSGNAISDIDETDPDFPAGAIQTEGTDPTTTLVVQSTSTFSENDGFFVPDSNETGILTGHLYLDENGNGTQNAGEADLPDIDIEITDSQTNTQIVSTDANGDWSVTIPTGNTISDIDETDPDFPAGAIQTEGTDPTTTLVAPNTTIFSEDDGFFVPDPNETGTLTGHLYLDENGDGLQNDGEADLPDIDIEIIDSQSNIQIVSTDADGDWSVTIPTGNAISDIDETDPDFPAGAIQTEGTDPTTTLVVPNTSTFSENDGFFVPDPNETGTLTGHLYLDENGDGTQNVGEADLADIDIEITDSQSNIQIVSTDANGDWSVTIPTGNAISDIDETDPDFPLGAIQIEGTDPTTTLVVQNTSNFSENDGFFVDTDNPGTLSGVLYLDENGNGVQDLNEPGIESVSIEIEDEDGNIETIETDFDGNWSILVEAGEVISLIDETDPDFPENAEQTEGSNPTLSQVITGETTNEIDGFFVPQEIEVFNAISPDGNGQNDFLRIQGLDGFVSNSIKIFNRNGVKVYDTRNYGSNGNVFRGISDGRITVRQNEKLPSGTYFYILNYKDASGNEFNKQGYLYIN